MITIIDYDAGNMKSVEKALLHLGEDVRVSRRAQDSTLDDASLADAAIHFALLSYAAGVASSRCVALLREKEPAAEAQNGKKGRGK